MIAIGQSPSRRIPIGQGASRLGAVVGETQTHRSAPSGHLGTGRLRDGACVGAVALGLSPRSAKAAIRRGPGRPAGAASARDRAPAKGTLRSV